MSPIPSLPIIGPLLRVLNSTEVRIWHIVLGFFVTSIFAWHSSNVDRYQDLLLDRSQNLVEVSSDFENRVSSFLTSGKSFESLQPDGLAALLLNIENQIGALNQIAPTLKSDQQRMYVDDYNRSLITLRRILRDGLDPKDTQEFGAAAQELVRARDGLLSTFG